MERWNVCGWVGMMAGGMAMMMGLVGCVTEQVPTAEAPVVLGAEKGVEEMKDAGVRADEQVSEGCRLFILRWNPDISSFMEERFEEGVKLLNRKGSESLGFNWSIWEHEAVRPGDWWVLCRVGNGVEGIVGAGRFASAAYQAASWRGDGKTIWYADMEILWFQDPGRSGALRAADLEKDFPEVDWHGGHAGVAVPADTAEWLAERVVREMAGLRRHNTSAVAVRRQAGGVKSALGAMVTDLCPAWMESAREAGRLTAGKGAWVDLKAVRDGKPAGECLRAAAQE